MKPPDYLICSLLSPSPHCPNLASQVSSVPGLTKSNASCGVKANQQEIGETLSNSETDTEIELEKPKLSIGGDNSKPKEFKESAMLEVAPTTVSRSVGRITHSPDIADCGETVKFGETSLKECGKQDRNAQDKTATVHQHVSDLLGFKCYIQISYTFLSLSFPWPLWKII